MIRVWVAVRDPDRRESMGRAGFARLTERFTVERMIAGTLAVYAHVAGTSREADTRNLPAHD